MAGHGGPRPDRWHRDPRHAARELWAVGRVVALQALLWLSCLSGTDAQVYECHDQCKVCHLFDHSREWHCLECHAGYELWVDGCFAQCPPGKYRYGYECQDCPSNCLRCVGGLAHECTECASNYRFDFRSLCVRDCLDGFYPTLAGDVCDECDSYCKTCIAGATISCTSCYTGYALRVLEPRTGSGECLQNCRKGFFRDAPSDRRCIQCSEHCVDCESLDNCFECIEGASLFRGKCYLVPQTLENEAVDFETYLASGAGLAWDPAMGPDWDILVGARRLQGDLPKMGSR